MTRSYLEWRNLETGILERKIELPDKRSYAQLALSTDAKTLALLYSTGGARSDRTADSFIEFRSAVTGDVMGQMEVQQRSGRLVFEFVNADKSLLVIEDIWRGSWPDGHESKALTEWDVSRCAKMRDTAIPQIEYCCISSSANRLIGGVGPLSNPSFFDLTTTKEVLAEQPAEKR